MKLPPQKTKIVCTIGPACRAPHMVEGMIKAGMNVARLNFSHANFSEHEENIRNIRQASQKLNRPVSILIDLPGVKMRIGKLKEPFTLKKGDKITLTTKNVLGTASLISVNYKRLPESVSKGSTIFLNDGFVQLRVERVSGTEISCRVLIGGKLLSNKGLNIPGAKLFVDPLTNIDFKAIEFGLTHGVTTFGLSFIETAKDIRRVREFAKKKRKNVYLVAKIERKGAIENYDEILKEADAIMVARGDLGIETPIQEVPIIQKELIQKANLAGIPVITATQMLGSMTQNIRPTRAEVNDVANAILDGTDAVMLSEETAIGDYPFDTVRMMVEIAVATEPLYHKHEMSNDIREQIRKKGPKGELTITDAITLNVVEAVKKLNVKYILSQTSGGGTARDISRFKPHCWILAFSPNKEICEFLNFSSSVFPIISKKRIKHDPNVALSYIKKARLVQKGDTIILTERRFSSHSGQTDSLGIITI